MKVLKVIVACIIIPMLLKPDYGQELTIDTVYPELMEYREELKDHIDTLKTEIAGKKAKLASLDEELCKLEEQQSRLLEESARIKARINSLTQAEQE